MIRRSERLINQDGMQYRYSRVHVLGFCVWVNQVELGRIAPPVPRDSPPVTRAVETRVEAPVPPAASAPVSA